MGSQTGLPLERVELVLVRQEECSADGGGALDRSHTLLSLVTVEPMAPCIALKNSGASQASGEILAHDSDLPEPGGLRPRARIRSGADVTPAFRRSGNKRGHRTPRAS